MNVELRELIAKVACFDKFVSSCGDSALLMRDGVAKLQNECNFEMKNYVEKVDKIIRDRDISEKKLANSAGLKIEMKKFSGSSSSQVFKFFFTIT